MSVQMYEDGYHMMSQQASETIRKGRIRGRFNTKAFHEDTTVDFLKKYCLVH